jgi:hypothetical protein
MLDKQGFRMQDFFLMISDNGNILASKLITFFGLSVGLGGGTIQIVAANSQQEFIQACVQSTPIWLAYVPAIAAITLSIKHIADMYYTYKDRKKDSK